jgi:hypothetical protein
MFLIGSLQIDAQYIRALSGLRRPIIVRATKLPDEGCLSGTIESDAESNYSMLTLVREMLGTNRDLAAFNLSASHIA